MTEGEFAAKMDEVDRLLNDPDISMMPSKVWELLEELCSNTGDYADF